MKKKTWVHYIIFIYDVKRNMYVRENLQTVMNIWKYDNIFYKNDYLSKRVFKNRKVKHKTKSYLQCHEE